MCVSPPAAVHEYARCLAVQLRERNVSVNCVAPGATVTPRFMANRGADYGVAADHTRTLAQVAPVYVFVCVCVCVCACVCLWVCARACPPVRARASPLAHDLFNLCQRCVNLCPPRSVLCALCPSCVAGWRTQSVPMCVRDPLHRAWAVCACTPRRLLACVPLRVCLRAQHPRVCTCDRVAVARA